MANSLIENNVDNKIGIVETGDTCTHSGGIAAGQYVIWKGVLYTADAAISVGEMFAASGDEKNLTACSDGGLNALNASLKNQEIYRLSQAGSLNNEVDSGISNSKMTEFNHVTMGLILQGARFFHMFTFPTSIWNENDIALLEGSDKSIGKGCGIRHSSSGKIQYYADADAILIFSN